LTGSFYVTGVPADRIKAVNEVANCAKEVKEIGGFVGRPWFPLMFRKLTKEQRKKLGKGKVVTIRRKKSDGSWTVWAS
ncbi:unnamed protein product, partial [Durusdinium trenchii]